MVHGRSAVLATSGIGTRSHWEESDKVSSSCCTAVGVSLRKGGRLPEPRHARVGRSEAWEPEFPRLALHPPMRDGVFDHDLALTQRPFYRGCGSGRSTVGVPHPVRGAASKRGSAVLPPLSVRFSFLVTPAMELYQALFGGGGRRAVRPFSRRGPLTRATGGYCPLPSIKVRWECSV
jgi:hypothetical protein